ncbi:MAG TPA: hypothetical protein HA348_00190 [Thermoplasmata archaeon]|nr:hypothetical protein [Thermoplasmata archaeon]
MKLSKDQLLRIINFCKTIEKEGTNPFDLDVRGSLETLKQYLPRWKLLDDLLLDAEAISEISKIIELQGKWIKSRSTSFFIDPLLIELKIKFLEPERLADAFFSSWHPICSMDRITPKRLKEGLDYWNQLMPLRERKSEFPLPFQSKGAMSIKELIELNILSKNKFNEELSKVFEEVRRRGKIDYWSFVYEKEFKDSVIKAYLTSYLVSDGKVALELDPITGDMFLYPLRGSVSHDKQKSISISLDYEDWLKWKRNQK